MLYINPNTVSPKIYIDFTKLLFEVSGISVLDDPRAFYQPVISYVENNFYQVKDSIYQRGNPSLTLHFYLRETGIYDLLMIRQLDHVLHKISEFKTYIIWYYNPFIESTVETGKEVENTFLNTVRLVKDSVHIK